MSASPITEEMITTALRGLPLERWPQVLAFIDSLRGASAESAPNPAGKRWTPMELRRLPPAERDAILRAQAEAIEEEYRTNPELTDFEAFGDEDLYLDDSDPEAR